MWQERTEKFCDCSEILKGVRVLLEIGFLLDSDCDAEISELKSVKTKILALVQNIPEPRFLFVVFFFLSDWEASWGNCYCVLAPVSLP